jgi:hypothetical protein
LRAQRLEMHVRRILRAYRNGMIPLDVNDPSTVACHSEISIDFGTPNRKTLICSGIAITEWSVHDDGTIYRETAVLNLRQTVLAVEQYTIAVGLASIGNGKTNFQFATDATNLQIDPDSGYLMLGVDMALMGDPSALDRISYQVVAVVTTQTTGISGTIRWSKGLFDASSLSATAVAQLFQISAGTSTPFVPPPGVDEFGSPTYTPRAYGLTTALSSDANDFILPYNIPGAPYDADLIVVVSPGASFNTGHQNTVTQTAGPTTIFLTISQPGVSGVDFRVAAATVPR